MEDEGEFPVNFNVIDEYFKEKFTDYFNRFDQGFILMVDPELYNLLPIDKDVKPKIKRYFVLDEGVEDILTDQLEPTLSKEEINRMENTSQLGTVIFILKPKKAIIEKAYMVRKVVERSGITDCNYLFVPRGPKYLSQSYLISNPEKITFINMNIVPFERDVLSLEINDSFFNSIQQEDLEYIQQSYEAISRLEKVYGTIKYKFACGPNAVNVLNKLLSVSSELTVPFQISDSSVYDGYDSTMKGGEIDGLILMDRRADLITPFCIQQTYEGMLDEHFGINATMLRTKSSIIRGSDEEEKKAASEGSLPKFEVMTLKSDHDLILDEIRDLHFVALESKFSQRVIDIDRIIKEKDNPKNVDDLEKYIEKLKNMKIVKVKDKLTFHINLAHHINSEINNFDYSDCLGLEQKIIYGENSKEMIESLELLMAKGADRDSILRLFALISITQGGIKEKVYQELFKQYIDCYGFEEMNTLLNMEEMLLFMKKQTRYKYDWNRIMREFLIINEETQLKNPIDYSYVYNGYSPLSVKVIDYCMSEKGFYNMDTKLKYVTNKVKYPHNEKELFDRKGPASSGGRKKVILVFYIGGITYSEISAIRFLNKLHTDKVFVVATTQIINFKKCIEQVRTHI
ncbi:unnamed protein product [Moneuplotes crassus]|uniref:Uncharacterized protein n=4 Tax=Euplotes crassus TaxID=5936 RepID=A0AAD1U6H9_EUPCR|nr:unnamed protein product [Moneuplotes crassus]